MNTESVLNIIKNYNTFSRNDLRIVMEKCGLHATDSTANHIIDKLVSDGSITRIGRNEYTAKTSVKEYSFEHSEYAYRIAERVKNNFPFLDFRIFELIQLNEFVNHQIGNNIVFLSVEGDLGSYVFEYLWQDYKGSILLNPTIEDIFRYRDDNMIIIEKLPTESPKGKAAFWDTRIEKMLVDIAVDKIQKHMVYPGEYPEIYREAIIKYIVDRSMMKRYASRRGALDKFRSFLENEAKISREEFSL